MADRYTQVRISGTLEQTGRVRTALNAFLDRCTPQAMELSRRLATSQENCEDNYGNHRWHDWKSDSYISPRAMVSWVRQMGQSVGDTGMKLSSIHNLIAFSELGMRTIDSLVDPEAKDAPREPAQELVREVFKNIGDAAKGMLPNVRNYNINNHIDRLKSFFRKKEMPINVSNTLLCLALAMETDDKMVARDGAPSLTSAATTSKHRPR